MGDRDSGRREPYRKGPAEGKNGFDRRGSSGRRYQGTQGRRANSGPQDRGGARSLDHRTDDDRPQDPELDPDVSIEDLDGFVRSRLRTLSKGSAERVGRHLVMAGRLLYEEPETAYLHAQAALRRAGRVDVVREAAALTAYATGRYAEALREVRTVRRLSGVDNLRAIEADSERGLGRPERALDLAAAPPSKDMEPADRVELAIVASGARMDMNQPEAALLELDAPIVRTETDAEVTDRVAVARAGVLRALGREDEARELEEALPGGDDEDDITLFSVPGEDESYPGHGEGGR